MKVAITKEMKRHITLEEAPYARQIIAELKDDDGLKHYAQMAAEVAGGTGCYEILKATAEIAKNERVFDRYGEGTGHLDVWLTVYAFNKYLGFYDIGICLSDIWQLSAENRDEIREHMFIREYTQN